MVFSGEKPARVIVKTCSVTAAYCLRSPFKIIFCRNITQFGRKLAAGRCFIDRAIVLQELVHCLQRLIVFIENLQVLHRS
jgi:hypothetical protein